MKWFRCSVCGREWPSKGKLNQEAKCPSCGATIFDKNPKHERWRAVPAVTAFFKREEKIKGVKRG